MQVNRAQTFYIRHSNPDYQVYDKMLHVANNIYNLATYNCQLSIRKKKNWPTYNFLNNKFKLMYQNRQNMLYKQCGVHFCQQILKAVATNFSNWYKALKAYHKNPKLFNNHRPRMPRCHKPGGMTKFILDNQLVKLDIKNQQIKLITNHGNCKIWWKHALKNNLKLASNQHLTKFQQLEVLPNKYYFKINVIYTIEVPEIKVDNHRYMTIDLGVNNLACIGSNVPEFKNYIINGRPVKSINQFNNKLIGKYRSILDKVNNKKTSHKIDYLFNKRYQRINHYFHEASKYIVDNALSHDISKIIVGNGCMHSKRGSKMSKKNNQNFIQIPFRLLFNQIKYKAENVGIEVIETEESFTSQTSFLDNEMPIRTNGDQARLLRKKEHQAVYKRCIRRVKRGLYISDSNKVINADLNGALQTLKKIIPDAFKGLNAMVTAEIALTPVKVNLAYC